MSNLPGCSMGIRRPIPDGNGVIFNLPTLPNSWNHDHNCDGGYGAAGCSLVGEYLDFDDWIENGLGREIVIYNEGQNVIYEGFVNKIAGSVGGLSFTRGPLLGIANRVNLTYSTVDTTTTPPVVGIRDTTGVANDTASQAKYGIIEKMLSAGGCTEANTTEIRDTYLAEAKDPDVAETLNLGAANQPVIALEIQGWVEWLKAYTYTYTTSGTNVLSWIIQNVLAADPNGIFSTDYSQIETSTVNDSIYDNNGRSGYTAIKAAVSKGNATNRRTIWGVGPGRRVWYKTIPTTVKYAHALSDRSQSVTLASGAQVYPWNIEPGEWLRITDFLIGRGVDTDIQTDPRCMFIESVKYTAPWSTALTGGRTGTLPQALAKLGLMGIGG